MLGDKEEKVTEYAWITSLKITKGNAKKIVRAGRNRWKIENQGFNRQKHWQGNIEHACSFQEQAQKNHYLMERIADFIKQLYEYFYLKKNEIKKLQKNIFPKWQALKSIYLSMLIKLSLIYRKQYVNVDSQNINSADRSNLI